MFKRPWALTRDTTVCTLQSSYAWIMPNLPQVWPSRGRPGRELVPRFCPEGWEFCTISIFCDIHVTPHNAIMNGEVHIHIEPINLPLLEVATLCVFYKVYNFCAHQHTLTQSPLQIPYSRPGGMLEFCIKGLPLR